MVLWFNGGYDEYCDADLTPIIIILFNGYDEAGQIRMLLFITSTTVMLVNGPRNGL